MKIICLDWMDFFEWTLMFRRIKPIDQQLVELLDALPLSYTYIYNIHVYIYIYKYVYIYIYMYIYIYIYKLVRSDS